MEGNRRAQFELYQTYSKAMFNICFRMMSSREEAEDVLQNAFVDVYSKLDSFRFESSVGAWIKRIVINHCINELKRKRIVFLDLMDSAIPDAAETSYNPGADPEEVNRVKKAIGLLPDGYRIVFSLYLLEGYDHKEISEFLGISEGASKSQFSRAKRRINEILMDKNKVG